MDNLFNMKEVLKYKSNIESEWCEDVQIETINLGTFTSQVSIDE